MFCLSIPGKTLKSVEPLVSSYILSLYIQPLVAFAYTNVKAAAFVDTTKFDAAPFILDPFLSIVRLLDAHLFPLSIK